MQTVFLYITAETPEEAASLGRTLVEERLAACVNVLGGITSFFWWEGAVQQGAETALIAKTRADLTDAVTARIKSLHGYDCPCVVALPIAGGNPDFLAWIGTETQDETQDRSNAPDSGADQGNAER